MYVSEPERKRRREQGKIITIINVVFIANFIEHTRHAAQSNLTNKYQKCHTGKLGKYKYK